MSKLRVSRDATADLDSIWLYIAERGGVTAAQGYIDYLTSKFETIVSMPGLGRDRSELKAGMRSHPVDEYVIYYRHNKGVVTILRIGHGARDIANDASYFLPDATSSTAIDIILSMPGLRDRSGPKAA